MTDQAEMLRKKLQIKENNVHKKTIAVVSGKGGVGKSNFSLNFSLSLAKKGHKVLLFDMDVGMGNIDILLGNSSKYTIMNFFEEQQSLINIVSHGPNGLDYIAGGTGLNQLFKFNARLLNKFTEELTTLFDYYEYVIFDMGAGATEESLHFILSVDEIIVVTTPEPTSITDAYAMLKHIVMINDEIPFYMIVNRTLEEQDGFDTFKRLNSVSKKFLGIELKLLGLIPDDRAIPIAVKKQHPFVLDNHSAAAKAILKITDRFQKQAFMEQEQSSNPLQFVSKLKRFLFER